MAVAAVQVATTQEFHDTNSVTSVTGSVTVTAGANLLVCFAHSGRNDADPTMTYNGVSMTAVGESIASFYSSYKKVTMFVLANPDTGAAHNLVATWTTARYDLGFTWATFSGYVSLGTFYSNSSPTNSSSANGSVTISDWASGDYAVGSIIVQGQAITAGDTEMGHYTSLANDDNYVSSEYATADGNLNWTHAAEIWAACGCAIKGAAAATFVAAPPYIKPQAINRSRTY